MEWTDNGTVWPHKDQPVTILFTLQDSTAPGGGCTRDSSLVRQCERWSTNKWEGDGLQKAVLPELAVHQLFAMQGFHGQCIPSLLSLNLAAMARSALAFSRQREVLVPPVICMIDSSFLIQGTLPGLRALPHCLFPIYRALICETGDSGADGDAEYLGCLSRI